METENTENAIVNITEDGGITKKILKKGEGWKTPTTNCDVKGMWSQHKEDSIVRW